MTQTGNVNLNGTLQIDAGHGYTITTASNITGFGASGGTVTNSGTFTDSAAGTSTISGTFSNTGTLSIATGATLIFGSGTETLGMVSGAGSLVFGFGSNATINSSAVTVSALTLNGGNGGAVVTLGTNLTYGGAFSFANQFDRLDLNDHGFTLSGASNSLIGNTIDGAGALKVTGAASIGGNIDIGSGTSSAIIKDAGAMTQTGNVNLNGTLQIDAGHGYTITTASNITGFGASGGTVTNNGTFTDSAAGTSTISGTFTNTGTLAIATGATLILGNGTETLGKVSGAGSLVFGSGSNATINSSAVTVSALTLNSGAVVALGTNLTYGGAFSFASQFGAMALNGHALTLSGITALAGGTFTGKDGAVDMLTVNSAHADLSNLQFSSWEATDRIALNGTGGNDTLIGSSLADVVNGGGGVDTMTGGLGDDTYYVDNAGDSVVEANNGGTDQVISSVGYSLSQFVENLTLTGAANINMNGNALGNTLVGNSGNNIIDGMAGADVMSGGTGNDTYRVDNAGDSVVEADNAGTDQVFSSVGYSLSQFVENLTLTGAANLNMNGNALGNTLVGNSGNNIIDGQAGADAMTGGGGSDTFAFSTSLVAGNVDTITDFSVAADKIRLSHTVFSSIVGTGTLSAAQFAANTSGTAQDANDRIIYETDTGKLFYDSNGSAAGGAVQFAKLSSGLALTANDFSII
jgi:Ca2+-binding RTX toxin-like protein